MAVPDIAIGAIVAACIAGFLSFLTLVASKEQKTSEFRQAWIDAVRDDIALLIGSYHAILDEYRVRKADHADAWGNARDDFVSANLSASRLRMRLNATEAESRQVVDLIAEMETRLNDLPEQDDDDGMEEVRSFIGDKTEALTVAASAVFRTEWKRVKVGEPIFRISKWVALGGGLLTGIALALRWFGVVN